MRTAVASIVLCSAIGGAPAQSPAPTPGARLGHGLVYDEERGRVVLFGGAGADRLPKGDTWEWDGSRWHRAAVDGPPSRNWPSMAYDAERAEVVLFGGREAGARDARSLDDMWAWNGTAWRRIQGRTPPGRDHAGMVYDRRRDQVVLFGGWDGQATRDDTWIWTPAEGWRRLDRPGPAIRAAQGMVYDERRGITWLHGGRNLETFYGDLWSFDGAHWTRHDVDGGPSPRAFQAAFYEPEGAKVVLYGGIAPAPLGDTWAWDGRSWTRQAVSGPPSRSAYAAAFDRRARSALFHGGGHRSGDGWRIFNETWRWSAADGWRLLTR